MAIIIGAVTCMMFVIYFFKCRVLEFRKKEREIYDLNAIILFFRNFEHEEKWKEFINSTDGIKVIRTLKNDKENFFGERFVVNDTDEYYAHYTIIYGNKKDEFYISLSNMHKHLFSVLKDTSFNCKFDENKIKMFCDFTIGMKVFVTSKEVAIQTLYLVLEAKERDIVEEYEKFSNVFYEIREMIDRMEEQKKIIRE